jgi:hypothetical protein
MMPASTHVHVECTSARNLGKVINTFEHKGRRFENVMFEIEGYCEGRPVKMTYPLVREIAPKVRGAR